MKLQETQVSLAKLRAEAVELRWVHDNYGIDMANMPGTLPSWLPTTPAIRAALREIADITGKAPVGVMLNRLEAGVAVPQHRDEDTGQKRYHLPIQTTPEAVWWDEVGGDVHMELGVWYGPVPFSTLHSVSNLGNTSRLHLVVDVS